MISTARMMPYEYDRASTTLPLSRTDPVNSAPRPSPLVGRAVVERLDPEQKGKLSASVYHQSDLPFRPAPNLRPVARNKEASFTVDKEWEGVIDDVGISHFTAQLQEMGGHADDIDLAEISIGDVTKDKRDLVQPGAVFRLLAGYALDAKGTVTRKRLVYFRKGKKRIDQTLETRWLEMAALFVNE